MFTRILSTCLLQSKLETCIYIIGRLHKESLRQIVGMESGLSEDKSVGYTKCQPVTSCNGFISFFYWSGVTISIMETVVNGGAFCKDNELFTPKLNFLSTITLINQR